MTELEKREWALDRAYSKIQALESTIANKDAEIQRLTEDRNAAETSNEALLEKLKSLAPHDSCACDYDKPGDVCAHHSPQLNAAEQEIQRLRQEVAVQKQLIHPVGKVDGLIDDIERLSNALKIATEALEEVDTWTHRQTNVAQKTLSAIQTRGEK